MGNPNLKLGAVSSKDINCNFSGYVNSELHAVLVPASGPLKRSGFILRSTAPALPIIKPPLILSQPRFECVLVDLVRSRL